VNGSLEILDFVGKIDYSCYTKKILNPKMVDFRRRIGKLLLKMI